MVSRLVLAHVEGNSLRGTARQLGIHRMTAGRWIHVLGAGCMALHEACVHSLYCNSVQLDELWSFVAKKQAHLQPHDPAEWGDAWIFLAFDPRTKMVVAYRVDDRTAVATRAFVADVRARVLGKPLLLSDGFQPYRDAIEDAFGTDVRYGQVVKEYEKTATRGASREGRYIASHRTAISGSVAPEEITTSLCERMNLTLRQGQRRLTRRTTGYSKTRAHLRTSLALMIAHYTWCRVHTTLRVTPAMEAGLTDHIWSVDELIDAAMRPTPANDAPPPTPLPAESRPTLRVILGGRS